LEEKPEPSSQTKMDLFDKISQMAPDGTQVDTRIISMEETRETLETTAVAEALRHIEHQVSAESVTKESISLGELTESDLEAIVDAGE
jgi:hypothetical protein